MSTDQLTAPPPLPTPDVAPPPDTDDGQPPRVVILTTVATDTIDTLLLLVAHGDHDAFTTLQERMTGLVLLNIRRVLRDAARAETVTQETFTDLLHDAIDFDPQRDDAQTWLLTRAHQHATNGLHSHNTPTDPHNPATHQPAPLSPSH